MRLRLRQPLTNGDITLDIPFWTLYKACFWPVTLILITLYTAVFILAFSLGLLLGLLGY